MSHKISVKIPVQPQDVDTFKRWAAHLGMSVSHVRADGDYYTVTTYDPIDLYWLGANMMGTPTTSSITKHEPT